jgi:TniQ protein
VTCWRRLPIPVPPGRHETVASYLARLANLHGLDPGELWQQASSPQPGTRRRTIDPGQLAAITDRPAEHLARALPELRRPGPDWQAWRHQPQPGCPRCDARHDGGPVTRLLPHHRYVCTRHRYWIGPPDAGQQATPLGPELADIVSAQWRHLRLLRRHGPAVTYDAALTGFLICGHLWGYQPGEWPGPWLRWTRRAQLLIPPGCEASHFSASRVFAAAYPEAIALACLFASPAWRGLAAGGPAQQQQFTGRIGQLLGRPGYHPSDIDDPIAHWMAYDSWRPPSRPHTTFPQTRAYGSVRPVATSRQSLDRTERSGLWFTLHRHGGNVILYHRHIQPVLIRDWSPKMDGITATIWASQTTLPLGRPDRPGIAEP